MRTPAIAFAVTVAAVAVLPLGEARGEGPQAADRTLTVEQVVEIVQRENPRVLQVLAEARSGEDLKRSATGRMLPSVHLSEEYQHWDSAYFAFGTTVRGQNPNYFSVAGDQPLLGLIHLSHERDAEGLRAEATLAELETARADLKSTVESQYLRLFEAKALEDIAKASEGELSEQVSVTQARVNAGVLTTADLLRVQVAVANAKQQEIQAHSQGEVARAALLGAIGLPQSDTRTGFAEPATLLERARAAPPSLEDAERQADAMRPELKEKRLQIDAARHVEKGRLYSLLPDVDLEASYLRTNESLFNPENAAFVGLKQNWTILAWG